MLHGDNEDNDEDDTDNNDDDDQPSRSPEELGASKESFHPVVLRLCLKRHQVHATFPEDVDHHQMLNQTKLNIIFIIIINSDSVSSPCNASWWI